MAEEQTDLQILAITGQLQVIKSLEAISQDAPGQAGPTELDSTKDSVPCEHTSILLSYFHRRLIHSRVGLSG